MKKRLAMAMAALALAGAPLEAGNKLMPAGTRVAVARSSMTVAPSGEWNKLAARPGRTSESWTLDGDALNDLTFYGGIESGRTLFRESDRHNKPLPRVSATMLVTDVPTLLENSYRVALDMPLFTIEGMEAVPFLGKPGVRFTYSFTRPGDDLPRKGEGRAAIIDGKLYMITFEAPRLHFFDQSIGAARQVADSAKL